MDVVKALRQTEFGFCGLGRTRELNEQCGSGGGMINGNAFFSLGKHLVVDDYRNLHKYTP